MKHRKYEELVELKCLFMLKKLNYRNISSGISLSLNAFNDKINGYSIFTTDEVARLVEYAKIDPNDIVRYFFPSMLRNAI